MDAVQALLGAALAAFAAFLYFLTQLFGFFITLIQAILSALHFQ
jgi:hypothetical protein